MPTILSKNDKFMPAKYRSKLLLMYGMYISNHWNCSGMLSIKLNAHLLSVNYLKVVHEFCTYNALQPAPPSKCCSVFVLPRPGAFANGATTVARATRPARRTPATARWHRLTGTGSSGSEGRRRPRALLAP